MGWLGKVAQASRLRWHAQRGLEKTRERGSLGKNFFCLLRSTQGQLYTIRPTAEALVPQFLTSSVCLDILEPPIQSFRSPVLSPETDFGTIPFVQSLFVCLFSLIL